SWITDGVTKGQDIYVANATNAQNNTTTTHYFRVVDVTADTITVEDTLAAGSNSAVDIRPADYVGAYAALQIRTLEVSRGAQLKDLNSRYGSVNGGVFNANYHYTLTQAEHDALVGSIKVWTKQELLYSVGAGLLQPVVDTSSVKEDANIIADNITIL